MLFLLRVSLSVCHVLCSDYMSIEEYLEDDEEPPLLLGSRVSHCEYRLHVPLFRNIAHTH